MPPARLVLEVLLLRVRREVQARRDVLLAVQVPALRGGRAGAEVRLGEDAEQHMLLNTWNAIAPGHGVWMIAA